MSAAAMLLLLAVVMAAGCSQYCVHPLNLHTITIVKLDSNGVITWEKSLDTGLSNSVNDLAPTSDGGFVTGGSLANTHSRCMLIPQARIIRFADYGEKNSGVILWDRILKGGTVEKIIPMQDGGFAALVDCNTIYRLDSQGNTIWTNNSGLDCSNGYGRELGETEDGGVVVGGPIWIKFSPGGSILWKQSNINHSAERVITDNQKNLGNENLTIADDGSYFHIETIPIKDDRPDVRAVKFYPNDTQVWNISLFGYSRLQKFRQVIQTTDSGYIIVFERMMHKDVSELE